MLALLHNLLNSRLGRAMRTMRGGRTLVESLGASAYWVNLTVFAIAAFLAALSGWLYAHMSRFISPTPFEPPAGIEYLMMAMIGGATSLTGDMSVADNLIHDPKLIAAYLGGH